MYRQTDLPDSAGKVEWVDLSRVSVSGRRYYSTVDFREKTLEITRQIIEIATHLHQTQCRAEGAQAVFPMVSPFASNPLNQPPPLRTA
jgi:hypothetical protein